MASNSDRPALVPIEEIIEEARNGRMFILVDYEGRENEGDLIIPAQMATPAVAPWSALDEAAMRQIAQMSVDDLVRHVSGERVSGEAPKAPSTDEAQ